MFYRVAQIQQVCIGLLAVPIDCLASRQIIVPPNACLWQAMRRQFSSLRLIPTGRLTPYQ